MSVHKIVSQQAHATVANCFFVSRRKYRQTPLEEKSLLVQTRQAARLYVKRTNRVREASLLVQTRQAARLYVKRTNRVREASLLVQTRQAARLYIINTDRKHNGRLLKAFTDFTE